MKKAAKSSPKPATPKATAVIPARTVALVDLPIIRMYAGTITIVQVTTSDAGSGRYNWTVRIKITPLSGCTLTIGNAGGPGPNIQIKQANGALTTVESMTREDTLPLEGPTYWVKSGNVVGKPLEFICTAHFFDSIRTPATGSFP